MFRHLGARHMAVLAAAGGCFQLGVTGGAGRCAIGGRVDVVVMRSLIGGRPVIVTGFAVAGQLGTRMTGCAVELASRCIPVSSQLGVVESAWHLAFVAAAAIFGITRAGVALGAVDRGLAGGRDVVLVVQSRGRVTGGAVTAGGDPHVALTAQALVEQAVRVGRVVMALDHVGAVAGGAIGGGQSPCGARQQENQ